MTDSRSSLGFLGRFGRSADLRALDKALREVDLHPNLMPEAVKLTLVKLLKSAGGRGAPEEAAYQACAKLAAYCMIGASNFSAANDPVMARQVERRIEDALESGDGLDSQIVLLAMHAGLIHPDVVETFGLESEEGT